jgi:hypothetical protein
MITISKSKSHWKVLQKTQIHLVKITKQNQDPWFTLMQKSSMYNT